MDLVLVQQELDDPNPEIGELFRKYDDLYFFGALTDAGFSVQWGSPPRTKKRSTTSDFGSCSFGKPRNTITLYERALQYRSITDRKNALLHLMIHAIVYVKHGRKDIWRHGPIYRDWMNAVTSCSIEDHMRPPGGYCITITHDFGPEKPCAINQWMCQSCGDTLLTAKKLSPPSYSCCIEDKEAFCCNMLCHWHNHMMTCRGKYARIVGKPPDAPSQTKNAEVQGTRWFLTCTSKRSNSQSTEQESDSNELRNNATMAKPNAKGKLLSLLGGWNAETPGCSSLEKPRSKRSSPEIFQKEVVLPASPVKKLKRKQGPVAWEKHEQVNKTSSSHKARKHHHHEDIQKPPVESAREMEYIVASAWLNYYELEGSSEPDEPLVNKRTERRKRERNRAKQILTYSRLRNRSTSGISSIKTQPPREGSSQQAKPPSPCLDIVVSHPADDEVVTQFPRGRSQPPAAWSIAAYQVVSFQSADPSELTSFNPSRAAEVVDISDED